MLHYTSNVEIDVRVGTNYSSKIVVNNTLILTIQNATFKALDCNKLHNVSLVWVSPGHDSNFSEGVECSLNHTNKGIRVICPSTYNKLGELLRILLTWCALILCRTT